MSPKNQNEEVVELRTHLRILSRTTAASLTEYDKIDELLDQIVEIICEELNYDYFGIGLANAKGQIVYRAGCGMTKESTIGLTELGEDIVGWVFKNGEPRLVPDMRREPRSHQQNRRTSSELCVPLRTHRRVIGVINVESDRPGRFTSSDLELLTTIANVVSGSLERIIDRGSAAEHDQWKLAGVTPREREVLLKITAGKSNKEIARELKIKENTVEAHMGRIFIKLGVQSRTEAMAWVERQGIWSSRNP